MEATWLMEPLLRFCMPLHSRFRKPWSGRSLFKLPRWEDKVAALACAQLTVIVWDSRIVCTIGHLVVHR